MDSFIVPSNISSKGVNRVLLSEGQIRSKVIELGKAITDNYKGRKIVCLGVLNGSVTFIADLIREINLEMYVDFVGVSRYMENGEYKIKIRNKLGSHIDGNAVLIVEDIVDNGFTVEAIIKELNTYSPASIEVCTLLHKKEAQKVELDVDYVAFEIPLEYVVGYGLDYEGLYRNLPYVGVLDDVVWDPEATLKREKEDNGK